MKRTTSVLASSWYACPVSSTDIPFLGFRVRQKSLSRVWFKNEKVKLHLFKLGTSNSHKPSPSRQSASHLNELWSKSPAKKKLESAKQNLVNQHIVELSWNTSIHEVFPLVLMPMQCQKLLCLLLCQVANPNVLLPCISTGIKRQRHRCRRGWHNHLGQKDRHQSSFPTSFCVWTIWTYDLSWGAWTAAPCWSVAKSFAVVEISSIPCQEERAKTFTVTKKNMTDKMHHTTDRKQNQEKTLCPTVVLRGMSRRRMGYLVRLSGKSLSFSRTRHMTFLRTCPALSSSSVARTSPSPNRRFWWWIAQHLALLARLLLLPPTFLIGSGHQWWSHYIASSWCALWWCPSLAFWWPHLPSLWVQKAPWLLPLLLGFCLLERLWMPRVPECPLRVPDCPHCLQCRYNKTRSRHDDLPDLYVPSSGSGQAWAQILFHLEGKNWGVKKKHIMYQKYGKCLFSAWPSRKKCQTAKFQC